MDAYVAMTEDFKTVLGEFTDLRKAEEYVEKLLEQGHETLVIREYDSWEQYEDEKLGMGYDEDVITWYYGE